jgi:survival motor neuron protein
MSFNENSNGLVWKRSTNCSESEDEVWDDRALINAYDKAVKKVNEKIANKEKSKQHKPNNTLINNNSNNDWHLGQYCRTVYNEDGIEYESQIISIDPQNNSCVVKYIGYGNEEKKSLNELKPSLSKRERKLQSQLSQRQDINNSNSDTDQDINCVNDSKQNKSSSTSSWFMPSSSNSTSQPIVPPPLPFSASSSMPNDDESLASMLMSWYMSGYHTGYYRALKQFKHNNCKCNK